MTRMHYLIGRIVFLPHIHPTSFASYLGLLEGQSCVAKQEQVAAADLSVDKNTRTTLILRSNLRAHRVAGTETGSEASASDLSKRTSQKGVEWSY